jgi:hypothetical protein
VAPPSMVSSPPSSGNLDRSGRPTRAVRKIGPETYCEDIGGAFLAGLAQKCTGPLVPG